MDRQLLALQGISLDRLQNFCLVAEKGGIAKAVGDDLSYHWVNAGYKTSPGWSDDAHYMGFLKSLSVAGMIAAAFGL